MAATSDLRHRDDPDVIPVAELRRIVKSFGATRAVRDVSVRIAPGQVVGLVGENGAGKSTLARVLAGVHAPDSGEVVIDGEAVQLRNPRDALSVGVSFMAQEIALVPEMTVEQNVLLPAMPSRGPFPDRRAIRERFSELAELTGFDLRPDSRVSRLRIAEQQKVEILRALSQNAKLIIMDEPSAALTADEIERLHNTIRTLAARGHAILLISHFLEEVLDLADEIVVMRDGALVRQGPSSAETLDSLVAAMVGKDLVTEYENVTPRPAGPARLKVTGLNRSDVLHDIDLTVGAGEIVGLAGLVGAGRTEIARAIFGADRMDSGTVEIDGSPVRINHPQDALRHGLFMVPESRKDEGLMLEASIMDNLLVTTLDKHARGGFFSRRHARPKARSVAEANGVRFNSVDQPVGSLSGGNQQKVLFARAKEVAPVALIVDEPTRGVDIAAKRDIHRNLEAMADDGVAILFISSEIEEVLGVCSRVLVVHRGRINAEFQPPYDQEAVIRAFFGQIGVDET